MTDRVLFRERMSLRSIDLDDEHAYHRERQALHNACPHGPGVVLGLAVTVDDDLRQATVAPGVAVSDAGRILVLREAQSIALDASSSWSLWLVAVDDEGDAATVTRCEPDSPPCAGRGVRIADATESEAWRIPCALSASAIVEPSGRVDVQIGARALSDPFHFLIRTGDHARVGIRRTGLTTIDGTLRIGSDGGLTVGDRSSMRPAKLAFRAAAPSGRPWSVQYVRHPAEPEGIDALRVSSGPPGEAGTLEDRVEIGGWRNPFERLVTMATGRLLTIHGSLRVLGRFRLAPLEADPSNPIFKGLLLSATIMGFRHGAAEGHITVAIVGPTIVPTRETWTGVVRITKAVAGTDPQLLSMLVTIDDGIGTSYALGGLTPIEPGVWEKPIPHEWAQPATRRVGAIVTARKDELKIVGEATTTIVVERAPQVAPVFEGEMTVGEPAVGAVGVTNQSGRAIEVTAVEVQVLDGTVPLPSTVTPTAVHLEPDRKELIPVSIPASMVAGEHTVEVGVRYRWTTEQKPWTATSVVKIVFAPPPIP